MKPILSVIIPVWNDEARIGLCLDALEAQSLPRELFEVIVVDNGSTDATAKIVAGRTGVTLLHEAQVGSYAARNLGLTRAVGDYLAFTDSDCVPDPDWLRNGLEAIRDNAAVGVGAGRVVFLEPQGAHSRACLNYERLLSMRQDDNVKQGVVITANWFSRRSLVTERGGFNATLKSGGDHELSGRISRDGLKTLYIPSAVVRHPARAQIEEITRKARRVVGGKWASTSGRFRVFRRLKTETRTFLGRVGAVTRATEISATERFELLLLLARLWLLAVVEVLRLQLGGQPARS
mgnify:CR=1 FL=1